MIQSCSESAIIVSIRPAPNECGAEKFPVYDEKIVNPANINAAQLKKIGPGSELSADANV